ncbi:hypothetical protein Dtox_0709 [Desulfofarcimen acetoxidans DSM 771]|uniref:DUF2802 domain-containing protein n=1 Tax=Desulfofarcimen acetoxidans (strain ATCC 49208 / DSM 771 / KCTC 5769 / VKM B-1644 / 5575) TaxID=485916 RepID=C8W1H8_DESAS|nr:hypothetical protein [Desulfofarcimen acetoxidans]ACV61623.1 hypothetical protein Dtox_0709 [Desulfofarcimen acetoxidans DSM 771]
MQDLPGWLTRLLVNNLFWISCGVLFSVVIACLVFFFIKKSSAFKKRHFARKMAELTSNIQPNADFEMYLKNIESRLDTLVSVNREMRDKISWLEGQIRVLLTCKETAESPKSVEDLIYEACEGGKPVMEVARAFGRDKGEIELILNIRRLKNNREEAL